MELKTEAETADYLRISPATLKAWRRHKRGQVYLKLGRAIRYDKEALDAWLDASAVAPGASQ